MKFKTWIAEIIKKYLKLKIIGELEFKDHNKEFAVETN